MLQRDGLVRSVNGVGSFVTRVLHSDLGRLVTTKSLINGAGFADKVEDCRISLTTHSPEWEERFEAPGPFVMIERTRSAEGQPIVRSLNVLPQAVCGDAFGTTLEGSLLEFLEKKLCIRISYSFSEIAVPRKDNLRDAAALALLGEETLLLRQMQEMKWAVPIIGGDATNNTDLVKIAGDAAAGSRFISPIMPADIDTPMAKAFLKAYEAKYHSLPSSIWSVLAGDAYNVLIAAIKAKGPDPAAIAGYLHNDLKNLDCFTGQISFDEKGDRVGDLYRLYEVNAKGEFILQPK